MTAQSKPVNANNFPFWKLPVLARSRVTKLMEQEDVIHLSMHSKLFKRLLMAFKIGGVTIKFHFWCKLPENVDFSEECHIIETYYSNPDDSVKLWCPHPDYRRIPENEQMLVHNNQMLVGRKGKEFEVNSALTFQEKLNTLEQITRHLLEIFHVEDFKLDYAHTNHEHIFGSFVWDVVGKFRSIYIPPCNASEREDTFDEEEKKNFDNLYGLSPEQTRFVFNEVKTDSLDFLGHVSNSDGLTGIQLRHRRVKVWIRDELDWVTNEIKTDSLEFLGHVSNSEELMGIKLKHRKVEVWNDGLFDWVTMDHVLDSGSEELCVHFEDIEAVKVVELLKKWQSGEKLVDLKKLALGYMDKKENQSLIEMLEKFEGVKMYSRKGAEEFLKEVGMTEVEVGLFFVQRTTDGKVATFYVDDETVHFFM